MNFDALVLSVVDFALNESYFNTQPHDFLMPPHFQAQMQGERERIEHFMAPTMTCRMVNHRRCGI